ncbi:MAG TPA: histidine kinase [Chitinophagaceae bacterium]
MLISLLLKLGFIACILFIVIPRFSARRSLKYLLLETKIAIALFLAAEFLIPGALSHKRSHSHDFVGSFWFHFVIYGLLLSICLALFFTKEWIRNERLKRQLIETQLTTELNFLKSQINPHFLFNTLNNLYSIAQRDGNPQLETGIYKLSGLMRYVIYETGAARVPLEREIGYIHDFIGLSRLRFTEEELNISVTVQGQTSQVSIAPMILIPFVENAFKHGVKIESRSFITILIKAEESKIIFECVNSLHSARHTEEQHSGIGLENVKRRLDLLYPSKHTLETIQSDHTYKIKLELIS